MLVRFLPLFEVGIVFLLQGMCCSVSNGDLMRWLKFIVTSFLIIVMSDDENLILEVRKFFTLRVPLVIF